MFLEMSSNKICFLIFPATEVDKIGQQVIELSFFHF